MESSKLSVDVLKSVTVFAGIDECKLLELCDRCRLVKFHKDDIVIREGTMASEIYIIISGTLKIILSAGKNPLEILELHTGHCVGEASVIGVQSHSASVIASEEVTLLELSRQVLMDICDTDSALFSLIILNIARELARRLYNTDQILLQMRARETKD